MEVERAIVDLYRTFIMRGRLGHHFQGTVTAVVGSGVFVQLDAPFVDVLVRLEDLGHDRWEIDDDALRAIAVRSGDVVSLGDRMTVEVIDASILRRTVYGRRLSGAGASTKPRDRDDAKTGNRSKPQRRRGPEPKRTSVKEAPRDTTKGGGKREGRAAGGTGRAAGGTGKGKRAGPKKGRRR